MQRCEHCGRQAHQPENDFGYAGLPDHIREGVQRYIEHHIPPGGFLRAVLSNDLTEACGRADETNRERLFDIVQWLYNEAPAPCWGSPDHLREWVSARKEAQ